MQQQPSAFAAQPDERGEGRSAPPRRILGIQPVLFIGICLLAIVSIITVALIFVGDFESQAPRVVWTVVVFLVFTGLLALDLSLSRRDPLPLVIGVIANTYLLAVLMIAIWVRDADGAGQDDWGRGWLFAELLWVVALTIIVVRAAAAAAWGLVVLGRRGRAVMARVIGVIAAALLGLVGVLLTLHFAISAFGIDVGEWYWRSTVAAIVIAALASSITVLLYWNRRNIDWQEAEARGEHPDALGRDVTDRVAPPSTANPAASSAQYGVQQHGAHYGGQYGVQQPGQHPGQPQGLLPWPTHPDGTPYPMGPDGQPVFPR